MATLTGDAFSLAQWFDIPEDASGPTQDFIREDVLMQVSQFVAWGQGPDGHVIVHAPEGRCIIEGDADHGIVWFDWVPRDRWGRTRFWMNRSSVAHLARALAVAQDRRRPFDELMVRPTAA